MLQEETEISDIILFHDISMSESLCPSNMRNQLKIYLSKMPLYIIESQLSHAGPYLQYVENSPDHFLIFQKINTLACLPNDFSPFLQKCLDHKPQGAALKTFSTFKEAQNERDRDTYIYRERSQLKISCDEDKLGSEDPSISAGIHLSSVDQVQLESYALPEYGK